MRTNNQFVIDYKASPLEIQKNYDIQIKNKIEIIMQSNLLIQAKQKKKNPEIVTILDLPSYEQLFSTHKI